MLVTLLPIFAAVVGGLLAISGGFLTNYILTRREKRQFLREKLEQIFLMSDEVSSYLLAEFGAVTAKYEFKMEDLLSAESKLMMTVKFYHPKFKNHAEDIASAIKEFQGAVSAFGATKPEEGKELRQERYALVYSKLQEAREKCEKLKLGLEDVVKNYT